MPRSYQALAEELDGLVAGEDACCEGCEAGQPCAGVDLDERIGPFADFKALRNHLAKKPGVTDPDALAASIERKVLGKETFQKLAQQGREKAKDEGRVRRARGARITPTKASPVSKAKARSAHLRT